ncbi:MAG: 4-hydroxythreonine-4-phosphate dehydrogenase PdxA, partial [Nitrospirota bacterium]
MKKIAITMGDAAGIGPEIIAKALYCAEIRDFCAPLVIGSRIVMQEAIDLLKLPLKLRLIKTPGECASVIGTIEFIDEETSEGFEKGKATAKNGKACVIYIKKAVELALNKKVDGIVTAPISKEA